MLTEPINAAIVLEEEVDRAAVEAALPPADRLSVTGVVHGLDAGRLLDETSTAQLLLVACSGALDGAAAVIRRWRSLYADRPAIALCESAPEYAVHALFKAGADDVVKLPETPERVLFSLEKALARHKGREADGRTEAAPMICVLGPKGGAGKTVTASNLAVALAAAGKRTALVDLDLQFGDVGLALGLVPESTSYDLATSGGALDAEKLNAFLATHTESGTRVLLAPVRPDQASTVSTELMRAVYVLLRSTHDVVVVDTPPDFTPQVISAVDVSSHVCVVGTLDSPSLKNTKLGLEALSLMGYDRTAISLVLNRANTKVGLTREDVEDIIGRKPDVLVPSDREVPRSVNEGTPIVLGHKRSAVSAAFRELAGRYVADGAGNGALGEPREDEDVSESPNGKGGRLRLIRGRGD